MNDKKFKLIVGDWSGDGHGQSADFYVLSNANSIDEIRDAYAAGVKIVGVDVEACCRGYDQFDVDAEDMRKIEANATRGELALAFDNNFVSKYEMYNGDFEEPEETSDLVLNPNLNFIGTYFTLWRAIALIGNPSLTLNVIEEGVEHLPIGGYGAF